MGKTLIMMERTFRRYENQTIAENYSKYRPTYPQQVWEKIFAFTKKHGVDTKMALDLACGAGQSTFELSSHYQRTVGADISKAQLERAREKATILGKSGEVEFVEAAASQLPFPDASVDLLTCAMAWHWLDPNTVFPEIERVLKSPGALAVYSYMIPTIRHDQCNKMFYDFVSSKSTWDKECKDGPYGPMAEVLISHYKNVRLPFPLAERHDMIEESETNLEHLRGYVTSLDSYMAYCRDHPEDSNALDDMIQEMKKLLLDGSSKDYHSTQLSEVTFTIDTPYFMLLAVKA